MSDRYRTEKAGEDRSPDAGSTWQEEARAQTNPAAGRRLHASKPQRQESEQEDKWFYNWGADLDPYLRALTGRTAYLGLKGTLVKNGNDWREVLARAGPVGAQLTERMKVLEGKGWSFGTLGLKDPYWDMTGTSLPARFGKMLYVGGYHADMFEGQPVKRIAINDKIVSLSNMTAGAYGRADAPNPKAGMVVRLSAVGRRSGRWGCLLLPTI